MSGYAAEVIADDSGKYAGNGIYFATKKEAEDYAIDLFNRWTLVRSWRVVEVSDQEIKDKGLSLRA